MSDTPSNAVGAASVAPIEQILQLLGGRPILLPIQRWRSKPKMWKGPHYPGWKKFTWDQTQDEAFTVRNPEPPDLNSPETWTHNETNGAVNTVWRTRRLRELYRSECNIGVVQGDASILEEAGRTWRLCSIDIDDTPAVDAFLRLNPKLTSTLRSVGSRGCNLWVWVEGEIPPLHKGLYWLADADHESAKVPGKIVKKGDPDLDRPFGEWRSTGGQTVIWGCHPNGNDYIWAVANAPVRVRFDEIKWPLGLHLPWVKREEPAAPPAPQQSAGPSEADVLGAKQELEKQYGDAWSITEKGKLTINQSFFAAAYAAKHRIFFSPEEQRFFRYVDDNGLWTEQTPDSIRWDFSADIKKIADDEKENRLINMRTTQLLNALVAQLRGAVEKWRAFERQKSEKTNRARALVHLQNGMLDLDEKPPVMRKFAPEFMSRNQLAVALEEAAECPRFLNDLLGKAVAADDIELMQKFAGQMLLGVNLTQMLLILTGTAGGGKSTFVNCIAEIIGRINVAQLRTKHLGERFEIFGFLEKTLLIGVDVPGNFMMIDGAEVIKALCGGDLLDAEAKTGNRRFQVKGEFNILITCNSRLRVKLDGDGDAWRRRLAIVNYEMPKPKHKDPNFVQKLIAEEGSGILNWMIEGAIKLLEEIDRTGGIVLTSTQKDRVESLLAESDSVRDFVRRGCAKATKEHKVTTEQLVTAYAAYCDARGWTNVGNKRLTHELPDALLEIHGATPSNDIKLSSDDKAKRGYRGVEILAPATDEEELLAAAAPAATGGGGTPPLIPGSAEDGEGGDY